MIVGVPTETKSGETRVALAPAGVRELTARGHAVVVEAGAGERATIPDREFAEAGARLGTAAEAWAADLVVKVKEPQPAELALLRDNVLLTFLHLAANPRVADALVAAGTTAVSYDTVQLDDGSLPLLAPMSAIAGRIAALEDAHHLLSAGGGRGVLLAGAPGAPGGRAVVLGAGVAGSHAIGQAAAMGADVVALDIAERRLAEVAARHPGVRTRVSTLAAVEEEVLAADLVIGAVLVPGRPAPTVVTRATVDRMRRGSVLVDIAIDQGGCLEVSTPTTHEDPVRTVAGSLVYAVANMPAAAGATATQALAGAALPYVLALAAGVDDALAADPALARGVNVAGGRIVHPEVAAALGRDA